MESKQDLTTDSLPYGEANLPLVAVSCYLCGASGGERLVDDEPFEVLRCGGCSFVYVTPRVPDSHLHLIYQTEYFNSPDASDYGYTDYTEDRDGYQRTFRKKADIVARFVPAGRVLEVGSAAGFFLAAMVERGFRADGVEVSEFASDWSRRELGLDTVFTGKLVDAPLEQGVYDVVAMWDVIEHLADPVAELERIRTFLRPDGHLFMQTQNVEAWFARLLGSKWQHYKQLEHIYHFSPKTIEVALNRAGFDLVHLTTTGAGKYISVNFFVDRMRRYSRIVHHLLRPLRIFGRRFFYLNPRDEIIVVARPKRGG